MNASTPDLQAFGWSLLHFVWQGAGCALLLASVNVVLRRATAQARYAAASAILLVMLGLPGVTFALLRGSAARQEVVATAAGPAVHRALALRPNTHLMTAPPIIAMDLQRRLEPWLPGLVTLWSAGVLLLSLRGLGGWMVVQRLRRSGLKLVPDAEVTLTRLIEALSVSTPVRLYESALVQVPTVIGWMRPVILLPASALTGLAPEQIELILAHELAHVRRDDYLVNLFQTAAETLLFYHPAVWWVSHRTRVEREHCCDDIAAASAGSALRYARALADLEELCREQRTASPALAMAATNGSLLTRIARLLGAPHDTSRVPRGLASLLATTSLCLTFGLGTSLVSVPSAATTSPATLSAATQSTSEPAPATPPARAERSKTPSAATEIAKPEGRAFPIERVLEMANAGVTPEYIDEMDALGYSTSSADQLVALRTQGVGPEFISEMAAAGFTKLSLDQLLMLRTQGVSGQFIAELKAQGLSGLSLADLTELRAQGVTGEYVSELKQAGHEGLSVSRLIALRSQGVSGRYVSELKALGYDHLSLVKLLGLRAQGVTPEYVRDLAQLGYRDLELPMLLSLRSQGVTPEFIRELRQVGYEGLALGVLLELRAHGVTPEFIQEMKAAGFSKLTAEELIDMRDQGVNPEVLQRLRGRQ